MRSVFVERLLTFVQRLLTSHIRFRPTFERYPDTANKREGEGNKGWPSGLVALSSQFGLQKYPPVTRNALTMGEVC